jgi:hypothetical protein
VTPPNAKHHASEDDLAAYAVHESLVRPDAAAHIASCPQCLREVAEYRLVEERLYRAECPDLDDLEAFTLGSLAGERLANVERHTLDCPRCMHELAALNSMLLPHAQLISSAETSEPAAETLGSRVREQVRRIVAQLLGPEAAPGLALRSAAGDEAADERAVDMYQAEDVELALRRTHGPLGITLSGQLVGGDGAISARLLPAGSPESAVPDEMRDIPTPLAEVPVSPGGYFELGPIPPGSYQLELLVGDHLIVISGLQLREPRDHA